VVVTNVPIVTEQANVPVDSVVERCKCTLEVWNTGTDINKVGPLVMCLLLVPFVTRDAKHVIPVLELDGSPNGHELPTNSNKMMMMTKKNSMAAAMLAAAVVVASCPKFYIFLAFLVV